MKLPLRIVVVVTMPVLALAVAAQSAGAAHRVGPGQYFTGVINGVDGNTAVPIPIRMDCLGPVTPGETGHPTAGQTLAVHQLVPPAIPNTLGRTGNDSTIDVFFGAPPPAVPQRARAGEATQAPSFVHYDRPEVLPTSLTLPCAGPGTVWFVPIPVVPPSRAAAVPVHFVARP